MLPILGCLFKSLPETIELAYRGLALSLQFIVLLINEHSPGHKNKMKWNNKRNFQRETWNTVSLHPTLPLYSYFLSKISADSTLANLKQWMVTLWTLQHMAVVHASRLALWWKAKHTEVIFFKRVQMKCFFSTIFYQTPEWLWLGSRLNKCVMSADVKSYIMTTSACQAALHLEMKKVDLMNDVSAALIRKPGPGQQQSPRSYFVLLGQPEKRAVSISLEPSLILSHQFSC